MSSHLRSPLVLLACLALLAPLGFAEDEPTAPAKGGDVKPGDGKGGDVKGKDAEGGETKKAKPGMVPVLKLLGSGSEPRTLLRYAPTPGTKLDFKSEITSDVTSLMGQMRIGPMKTTVRVAFAKGKEEGQFAVAAEITDAVLESDGSNPMAANMKPAIEGSKGTKLSGTLSDCGVWKTTPSEGTPSIARDTLQGQMLTFFPPLPTEAIGMGAKWTVTVRMLVNGVGQTSVVTAEVTKIEGGRVELKIQETRAAKDEKMNMMGQEIPIETISGTGSGSWVIDLALGGVSKATTKIETKMVMNMMGQQMETTSKVSTSVSSKAPAAVTEGAK